MLFEVPSLFQVPENIALFIASKHWGEKELSVSDCRLLIIGFNGQRVGLTYVPTMPMLT